MNSYSHLLCKLVRNLGTLRVRTILKLRSQHTNRSDYLYNSLVQIWIKVWSHLRIWQVCQSHLGCYGTHCEWVGFYKTNGKIIPPPPPPPHMAHAFPMRRYRNVWLNIWGSPRGIWALQRVDKGFNSRTPSQRMAHKHIMGQRPWMSTACEWELTHLCQECWHSEHGDVVARVCFRRREPQWVLGRSHSSSTVHAKRFVKIIIPPFFLTNARKRSGYLISRLSWQISLECKVC